MYENANVTARATGNPGRALAQAAVEPLAKKKKFFINEIINIKTE